MMSRGDDISSDVTMILQVTEVDASDVTIMLLTAVQLKYHLNYLHNMKMLLSAVFAGCVV